MLEWIIIKTTFHALIPPAVVGLFGPGEMERRSREEDKGKNEREISRSRARMDRGAEEEMGGKETGSMRRRSSFSDFKC